MGLRPVSYMVRHRSFGTTSVSKRRAIAYRPIPVFYYQFLTVDKIYQWVPKYFIGHKSDIDHQDFFFLEGPNEIFFLEGPNEIFIFEGLDHQKIKNRL